MNKNLHFSIGDKSDSIRVDDEDGQITGDRLFPILTELNALPALVETLTHELENVWKPAAAMASQYAKCFEDERDEAIETIKAIRESIAAFLPAEHNIQERTTLDALNELFKYARERK